MRPALVVAVHGTRDVRGTEAARALVGRVAARVDARVELAFADVRAPDVGAVAAAVAGPVVVVPAFLASGYHVRVDIPAQLERVGRCDVCVTEALGADPRLVVAAAARLVEAGWRPGDAVVLAAAGSSDPGALAEVADAAERLGRLVGARVRVAYAATASPRVDEVVAGLRAAGHERVAVASWLLAPGLFHARVVGSGADVVAGPLFADEGVVEAVVERYRRASVAVPA
ncbi:sirohydrochlorin chelatase [Thermobifida halotolerans]|uniref:Sirohydrochlorin chelatase n=1 Tax=Thermobifida halotolerans TaxID=483545 RepID=A0AA97M015_9ACTN|nr:CbiX/SirB N-terminal domain-containing protein [Thermobifida halotolerans]UOE20983.1 sirohydrochlorin chelatase [Thermobifida halotolerans]